MESKCLNCSNTCPPSNGQRQRKYCSKECANEYLNNTKRYGYTKSSTDLAKRKAQEKLGISRELFNKIIKKYNIKLEISNTGKSTFLTQETFEYIKNNLEKFKNELRPTSVPDGWDTYEIIANKLGKQYSHSQSEAGSINSIFKRYGEPGQSKNIILADSSKQSTPPTKVWKSVDVDAWVKYYIEKKEQEAQEIEIQKQNTLLKKHELLYRKKVERIKKNVQKGLILIKQEFEKQQEEYLFQEQIKDRIVTEQAVVILGVKSISPLIRNLDKLPGTIKIKNKFYFLEEEVQKLKLYLKKEKKKQQKQSIKRKKVRQEKRSPKLKKDWTTDEVYEERLWKKIQKGLPKNLNKQKDIDRWNNNKRLMKNGQLGIIKKFVCVSFCKQELPYTSFYFDVKKGNEWGREYRCKACAKKRNEGKERVKKPKTASRFATQFTMSIRQELSRRNGYYMEIAIEEIWEGIEKYCGYTKEQFIENIESKLAPWMTWENNKRPDIPGERTWQLDHIVPRVDFKYTRMSDPEFALCWALSNLEPLESRINLIKSNKNLLHVIRSSFMKSLREGIPFGKIWKHLDYTPQEARDYLEKQWGQPVDWKNFKNSGLEVDHIIPQAYLSFSSFSDKNFSECWSLKNLQLLPKKQNIQKSSLYNNILWAYNHE